MRVDEEYIVFVVGLGVVGGDFFYVDVNVKYGF